MQIETIEKQGDVNKIWGLSTAKSFRTWLQSRINIFMNNGNKEEEMKLRAIMNAYDKFHPETRTTVDLHGWKGNDEIKFIEKPDSFDIITHQRPDKDSEVKETKRNISKIQVNNVIDALNQSKLVKGKDYIKTKEIARNYCLIAKIKVNKKGNELFQEGLFEWERFFGDRRLHTDLNLILRLLDEKLVIYYWGGRTKILNKGFKFQLRLP